MLRHYLNHQVQPRVTRDARLIKCSFSMLIAKIREVGLGVWRWKLAGKMKKKQMDGTWGQRINTLLEIRLISVDLSFVNMSFS